MVVFGIIPLADVYKALDGPILIMLAALIPVADTLRTTGGSELLADWLGEFVHHMPAWGALALILVTAMAVTPFLNNAATVLVMAPIAASLATTLGYRPEAFLMAVAIGAGHGPGRLSVQRLSKTGPAAVDHRHSCQRADAADGLAGPIARLRPSWR